MGVRGCCYLWIHHTRRRPVSASESSVTPPQPRLEAICRQRSKMRPIRRSKTRPPPARPSTAPRPGPVRPGAAEHHPPPAAGSKPNPPLRSPIQSVWVASFSTIAMASSSSVVDTRWRRVKTDPSDDDREVLNVEDWAEIRRLHRGEGLPIRAIARQLGVGRNRCGGRWPLMGHPSIGGRRRVRRWMRWSRRSGRC